MNDFLHNTSPEGETDGKDKNKATQTRGVGLEREKTT